MPKIKVARKSVSLDMTAMCDMAFLLLTFFMLTTKFKPQEALVVDIPSSVAEVKLPEKDIMTISVRKDGAIFFGVDDQYTRKEMFRSVAKKHNVNVSEAELQKFALTESFGMQVQQLPQALKLTSDQFNALKQSGVPADSLNNQLGDWIYAARVANKQIRIAIKGDKESNYEVIDNVIETLQDQKINKFNLITSMENRPK